MVKLPIMKTTLAIFVATLSLLLGACASHRPIAEVSAGMTSAQVREALGEPADKSFEGSFEKWVYPQSDGSQRILTFRGGKLTSLVSEKDGKLSGASAAASAVSKESASTLCVGTNDYGSYADGGGCNMYGCWPRGGYCNGFGCSATGRCTNQGCPKKISSFLCTE
jgi:hypothetical protein